MPELPEIETILKGLKPKILNLKITSVCILRHDLRWPIPKNLAALLCGEEFKKIERRGKYLLLSAGKGHVIIHLGLTGQLLLLPVLHRKNLHEHLTISFANQTALCFVDPRRFGAFLWTEDNPYEHPLLKKIGPEPLTADFNAEYLAAKAKRHQIPIKQVLMDSHIVAGVGNIYASEALFLAKVNPLRSAKGLSLFECEEVVVAIKKVLLAAIASGGSTIRDFAHSDGKSGYFQEEHKVYGREGRPCVNCKTKIKNFCLGSRSTFYCPHCQK